MAGDRECLCETNSRSALQEIRAIAGGPGCSIAGVSRRHLRDALPVVGARTRFASEHDDDGPCHQAGRLDAKKKTLDASERNEEARAAWREQRKQLDARKLVVIDECGSNISLTPLYARAPRGLRAYGSVPRNRGKNTTLIAALSFEGMGESMIIEGSANAAAFERYIEEILTPSLTAGQIVIMDNLIQARGCQLLFLPAYSPDFSPIEETFSKLKTYLPRIGARSRETLQEAICQALLTVTAQDAQGWFGHCGYLPAEGSA
jgi:transposase